MDEQIEMIYMIALECLANLIAPKKDEVDEQSSFPIHSTWFFRKFFLEQHIGHVDTTSQV